MIHRFANGPVRTLDSLHWDVLRLHTEMLNALRLCAAQQGSIDGVGVDTWGVDFALLGRGGTLLGNPRHYRDPHTEGVMEQAFARVPRRRLSPDRLAVHALQHTLSTAGAAARHSPLLDVAESLLFMPDLFHFFLTGIRVNEYTDASTSQMLDPTTRSWAYGLVQAFGLPQQLLGTLVQPGTVLGPLRPAVAAETGINPAPVIAPATHDTGSAVAAVPAVGSDWAYISSGTWSLVGVELPAPLLTDAARAYNFTNEGGVAGTTRLLKNVMGLWLVQECRRTWERQGQPFGYDELARLAEAAAPFVSLVDPDDASFILPPSMPAALAEFCRRSGQPVPQEAGAVVHCALESLALRYRWVLERLEELTGTRWRPFTSSGGDVRTNCCVSSRRTPATVRCWPARSRRRPLAMCSCRRWGWASLARWPKSARWCGIVPPANVRATTGRTLAGTVSTVPGNPPALLKA